MYYAAMRPAEVIHLQISRCHLPKTGWGMLNLSGGVVTAGKEWTDDGAVHEVHSLKRRAVKATRPVPIPPSFVHTLRKHVDRFGVAPDGRVFRNAAGGYVDAAAHGKTWERARKKVLAPHEQPTLLAKRPYDLRHAGISFWLHSGVDPAECARRAGQSIQVLFQYYAKFLDGLQEHSNRLIEESMQEWSRRSGTAAPRAEPQSGPCMARNCWSGLGYGWDELGEEGYFDASPAGRLECSKKAPDPGKPQVRRLFSCR